MIKIRPFLKWAGNKYNCLQNIVPEFPQAKRLIEPFSGSAAIFMNTCFPSYLLAESNPDLVFLFNALKKEGQHFISYCEGYFQPQFNCEEKYYELRSEFNSMPSSEQKSAIFLYLNRHGYNGLCRYNASGQYNVPFGLYKAPYFPYEEMTLFHEKSKEAQFLQNDFRSTFKLAKSGDIIYCDPPYVPLVAHTRPVRYTQKGFEESDQVELANLARQTAARGIPVLISNHDTEFTRSHYSGATIKSFKVARYINCQRQGRQPVNELLALFPTP